MKASKIELNIFAVGVSYPWLSNSDVWVLLQRHETMTESYDSTIIPRDGDERGWRTYYAYLCSFLPTHFLGEKLNETEGRICQNEATILQHPDLLVAMVTCLWASCVEFRHRYWGWVLNIWLIMSPPVPCHFSVPLLKIALIYSMSIFYGCSLQLTFLCFSLLFDPFLCMIWMAIL